LVLGKAEDDVWIRTSTPASSAILLAESSGTVDSYPQDTQCLYVLLDIVSCQYGRKIDAHGLGGNIHACSSADSIIDEISDQGEV
jgi:hypothetical protein